jgi:hypothetical protein
LSLADQCQLGRRAQADLIVAENTSEAIGEVGAKHEVLAEHEAGASSAARRDRRTDDAIAAARRLELGSDRSDQRRIGDRQVKLQPRAPGELLERL